MGTANERVKDRSNRQTHMYNRIRYIGQHAQIMAMGCRGEAEKSAGPDLNGMKSGTRPNLP